jgi:hypothetical protein
MKPGRERYRRDGFRGEKLLRKDLAACRESSDPKTRGGGVSSDPLMNGNSKKRLRTPVNRSKEKLMNG